MITSAQISTQPESGKYAEQIYEAPLSTLNWTWVKFEDEHYNEFYGQFHGSPKSIALSEKNPLCYVLTNEFLYEIDRHNPSNYVVRDFWDCGCTLTNVTFMPNGIPLFSNDYVLFTINNSFEEHVEIENPIQVDLIAFDAWEDHLLHINAETFFSPEPVKLVLDANTMVLSKA